MRTGRIFLLSTLVAAFTASGALAVDELAKRDVAAFENFAAVRTQSLEDAIAKRDRDGARELATRLQAEECRFLERVVRYLKDDKQLALAMEMEAFLADYRGLSLKDCVRVRRQQGPGRSLVVEMAMSALMGQHLPGPHMAAPAAPVSAPIAGPGAIPPGALPPGALPPGFNGATPASAIGQQVPSRPADTAYTRPALKPQPSVLSDVNDERVLASNHASAVSLDSLRSHSGGAGAAAASAGGSAAGDAGALASNIRRPPGPAPTSKQ